jgi:putative nucleotidyltransferase with HDIG domain
VSPNPAPLGGDTPAPLPNDERFKNQGTLIVTRLLAAIRTGRAYQVGNQVFSRLLEGFLTVLEPIAREFGEVVFVDLKGDLFLNGSRLPVRAANFKLHELVRKEFERRRIAGFRGERGMTLRDVEIFFGHFLRPDEYAGSTFLDACVGAGATKLVPVVHASAAPGNDAGGSGGGGSGIGDGGGFGIDLGTGEGMLPGSETEGPDEGGLGWLVRKGPTKRAYQMALNGMRTLLDGAAAAQGIQLKHAKRVVQPLVDSAFSKEPLVVGLTGLGHHDDYTYSHAVNVCIIAVALGQVLGLDRRALADLGVAALLHDIGKASVAEAITNPIETLTPEEKAAAERHPVEGVKLMARATMLNETTVRCMRVALEHHAGPGGYPLIGRDWTPSLLSRIVAVADCYVNLLTHRSAKGKNVTPYKALAIMFGPLQERFDPAVLGALIQTVGFYPPGQMVKLDDDSVAIVLAANRDDPARPHVRIVIHPDLRGVRPGENVEFHPLPKDRSVKRALRAKEYPEDLTSKAA